MNKEKSTQMIKSMFIQKDNKILIELETTDFDLIAKIGNEVLYDTEPLFKNAKITKMYNSNNIFTKVVENIKQKSINDIDNIIENLKQTQVQLNNLTDTNIL